ncbi:MAG: ribonuclease PH [Synergistaceae bacterium]
MQIDRIDGRSKDELRTLTIERGCNRYAEGSALIKWGNTHVLCTATVEEKVPSFIRGSGKGWLTAEYSMLPRSTHQRMQRDSSRGKINGRGSEIQRLIGRSLRAAIDMEKLGERTITIDCDVIQADAGTRTASITAGFVALYDAIRWLIKNEKLTENPITTQIAAVSIVKINGQMVIDPCYEEDSSAEVDSNIIMTSGGNFVELQGTGEQGTFSLNELNEIAKLAWEATQKINKIQQKALCLTQEEIEAIKK